MFYLNILFRMLLSITVLGFICGCSPDASNIPGTVPVRGTVLFKGEPLGKASVIFLYQGTDTVKATINATTDEMGRFELKSYFTSRTEREGVIPGTYTVTVLKMVPPGKMTEDEYQLKVAEADEIVASGGVLTLAQTPPELKQLLPKRYCDITVSELEVEVLSDQENDFLLDLK